MLLMFILALSRLDTQRSYRARKPAAVDAVLDAVAAGAVGGNGFAAIPSQTTSAQEGELDAGSECHGRKMSHGRSVTVANCHSGQNI